MPGEWTPLKARFAIMLWCGIATMAAGAPTESAPTRLAVVCAEPETREAGDLLTVELSRMGQIQLLEREQIDKVYREQALSVANRDLAKLGQILGADGLLVMQIISQGTNQFLQSRLVAVKPGVAVDSLWARWPLANAMEWPRLAAARILPLLPKLKVRENEATPISVLNFRSSLRGGANESLERELTVLLIHRLTREPGVFVLERQRLGEALLEKEFK